MLGLLPLVDVLDMLPTPGAVIKLTAVGRVSTVKLVGGPSVTLCKARPAVGGARAIRSTVGRGVLTRPRLLVSILPVVLVDDNDEDDDGRDDVNMTSRRMFAIFLGVGDVIDSVVALLATRCSCSTSACRHIIFISSF